jgi:hypothetical protein
MYINSRQEPEEQIWIEDLWLALKGLRVKLDYQHVMFKKFSLHIKMSALSITHFFSTFSV